MKHFLQEGRVCWDHARNFSVSSIPNTFLHFIFRWGLPKLPSCQGWNGRMELVAFLPHRPECWEYKLASPWTSFLILKNKMYFQENQIKIIFNYFVHIHGFFSLFIPSFFAKILLPLSTIYRAFLLLQDNALLRCHCTSRPQGMTSFIHTFRHMVNTSTCYILP